MTTPVDDIVAQVLAEPQVPPTALSQLTDAIKGLTSALREVQLKLKVVEKEDQKLRKEIEKVKETQKKKRVRQTGFVQPAQVSDEMCDLLGIARGTQKARMEVLRLIYGYIKHHKLQDPSNGRTIIPNEELARVLKWTPDQTLTYFNIQTFLKHHFKTIPLPAPTPDSNAEN
jgi:chromatin remodeling complex protein RSC6